MKENKNYKEKLQDEKWIKLSGNIRYRDGNKCSCCSSSSETLNVHHKKYRNVDPWEYSSFELITLCESCHQLLHVLINDKDNFINRFCYQFHLVPGEIRPEFPRRPPLLWRGH